MKKKLLLLLIFCIAIGVGFGLYRYHQKKVYDSMEIIFKDIDIIEYGNDINSADLIESAVGKVIQYPNLSTMKTGKQSLVYVLEKEGIQKEITTMIEIKDTQFPLIELKSDHITLEYGVEYDPQTNIDKVYDTVDGELEYTMIHEINSKQAGNYEVKVSVKDKNGNATQSSFTVTVKEKVIVEKPLSVEPTYINGILLVNKQYGLPANFGGVNAEANNALTLLQKAANQAGYSLPLVSGYRSYSYQYNLYNGYVAKYGKEATDRFSAQAGHSEHQTGLAFDVGKIDYGFGSTPEGKWLEANCAEFGFIIRYMEGKEDITGYRYEPWHIRYVGVEHAKAIMERNITLEEYLGIK